MTKVTINSEQFQLRRPFSDESQSFSSEPSRWRMALRAHVWRPPTDVYEKDDSVVVRVEIAGMKDEDFSISLTGRSLAVRGVRPDVPERKAYHQMEIFFGEFMTEVELPCAIIADEVRAEYQRGLLRIVLPKQKAHKIQVED